MLDIEQTDYWYIVYTYLLKAFFAIIGGFVRICFLLIHTCLAKKKYFQKKYDKNCYILFVLIIFWVIIFSFMLLTRFIEFKFWSRVLVAVLHLLFKDRVKIEGDGEHRSSVFSLAFKRSIVFKEKFIYLTPIVGSLNENLVDKLCLHVKILN